MRNLDILAKSVGSGKGEAKSEVSSGKLSDEDVTRIAERMVQIMAGKTDSVTDDAHDESLEDNPEGTEEDNPEGTEEEAAEYAGDDNKGGDGDGRGTDSKVD